MRAKEIISKKIINPIRSAVKSKPKLFLIGLVSLLGALPLASLPNRILTAFAQQQAQALNPWSEALRTARAKMEAATSPGALGHGVQIFITGQPQIYYLYLELSLLAAYWRIPLQTTYSIELKRKSKEKD